MNTSRFVRATCRIELEHNGNSDGPDGNISRLSETRSVPRHHHHYCAKRLDLPRSTDRDDPYHSSPYHQSPQLEARGAAGPDRPRTRHDSKVSHKQSGNINANLLVVDVHVAIAMQTDPLPHHMSRVTESSNVSHSRQRGSQSATTLAHYGCTIDYTKREKKQSR